MQSDFAVELGRDDDTLEFPWSSPEGGVHYLDLKRHPELLPQIEEARRVPELGEFLSTVNSPSCILETVKCDAWASTEINPEEKIFEAAHKFGSYVDLLFFDQKKRFSFPAHEGLAKQLAQAAQLGPEIAASTEFIIRRCYYHMNDEEVRDGFYITFYLFGYGDKTGAREHWVIGLKFVQNAICELPAH